MNQHGPIIIIEDDLDDHFILEKIFKELGYPNEVIFFDSGLDALAHLEKPHVRPFLVISDINMPIIDGFGLRQRVFDDEALRNKCVPYLFFTNGATPTIVKQAYKLSVQGFFKKPSSVAETKVTLRRIIEYWQECVPPN